ncbi:porin family protein [Campylobacter fetus]|uniref:hypothetical protein n=1 Tax=Campylobacter fetus TaxID=196 RepID=UPI003AF49A87
MKKIIAIAVVCGFSLACAKNLADPDVAWRIKPFGLPKPLTNRSILNPAIENNFDFTQRQSYYYANDVIDKNRDTLHISGGFIGKSYSGAATYDIKTDNADAHIGTYYHNLGDYKGGNGKYQGVGYERNAQDFGIKLRPKDNFSLNYTFIRDEIIDDLLPSNALETIRNTRYLNNLKVKIGEQDNSNTLNLGFSYGEIKRYRSNEYKRLPNMVKFDSKTATYSFLGEYAYKLNDMQNFVGVSYKSKTEDGYRRLANGTITGWGFPGLDIDNYRVYNTFIYELSESHALSLGLNYDWFYSDASKLNSKVSNGKSLNDEYERIYGERMRDNDYSGLSAKLRYDYKNNGYKSYLQLASLYVAPYLYNSLNVYNYMPNSSPYLYNIGAPNLKSSRHNLAQISSSYNDNAGFSFTYDSIEDLVIYDRLRSSDATLDGTIIRRNVNADYLNAKGWVKFDVIDNLSIKSSLTYHYGQNRSDDRPLYQIRPIEFNTNLDYKQNTHFGQWSVGSALRWVGVQSRGDWDKSIGLGSDLKDSAKAFATVDLYSGINIKNRFGVRFGIANIFDEDYSEFINPNHLDVITPSFAIKAPGRTVFMSFNASF